MSKYIFFINVRIRISEGETSKRTEDFLSIAMLRDMYKSRIVSAIA